MLSLLSSCSVSRRCFGVCARNLGFRTTCAIDSTLLGLMGSSLFPRREKEMPDGNGGTSGHDTDVGSIYESAHLSRSDDERSAHVPDPTHMITQPEDESKNQGSVSPMDSVDVLRNEDGIKDLVLGQLISPSQTLKWGQISELIPERRSDRCRQRWDTIIKPYKKVKRHCDAHGKDVSQVTEQEVSMKLGMDFARNRHWFKMIDEYYSSKSGVPRNNLNGAIAPTAMVG